MNLNLPTVDEAYLKSKVEAGYYVNMAEAIRDAIRRMREADEEKGEYNTPMLTAVLKGEEQYAKGQYRKYGPQVLEEIERNADKKIAQGKHPKPEIVPHEL